MTTQEVKTILHACRDPRRDASDPQIAEALACVEKDPDLQEWFADWQAFDNLLAAKLKAAPLPEGLLEQVNPATHVPARQRRIRYVQPLALAACLMVLGVLAAIWLRPSAPDGAVPSLVALRADMADFLNEFPRLDLQTDRLEEARLWLAEQHPLTQVSLPADLQSFPTIGCRTVNWQGGKVALVCFMVDGEVVHLLLLPAGALPDGTSGSAPQYASAGRFQTASWVSGETRYLAMTPGDEDLLRGLL